MASAPHCRHYRPHPRRGRLRGHGPKRTSRSRWAWCSTSWRCTYATCGPNYGLRRCGALGCCSGNGLATVREHLVTVRAVPLPSRRAGQVPPRRDIDDPAAQQSPRGRRTRGGSGLVRASPPDRLQGIGGDAGAQVDAMTSAWAVSASACAAFAAASWVAVESRCASAC